MSVWGVVMMEGDVINVSDRRIAGFGCGNNVTLRFPVPKKQKKMGSDGNMKGKRRSFVLRGLCLSIGLACCTFLLAYISLFFSPLRVVEEEILLDTHQVLDKTLNWCHFSIAPNLFLLSTPGSMLFVYELTACTTSAKMGPIVRSKIIIESVVPGSTVHGATIDNVPPLLWELTCEKHDRVLSPTKGGPKRNIVNAHDHRHIHGRCEVIVATDHSAVYRVAVHNLPKGTYRYKVSAIDLLVGYMESSKVEQRWYHFTVIDTPLVRSYVSTSSQSQPQPQRQRQETKDGTTMYVISDVQSGASIFRSALEKMVVDEETDPGDVLVHVGDAVQNVNHSKEWYAYMFGPLEEEGHMSQRVPLIFARGNHDHDNWRGNRNLHPLGLYTTGTHYMDYIVGDIYVVVLDSNIASNEKQLLWFESKMVSKRRQQSKFTVVIVHIAPFVEYWEPDAWNIKGEKHWGENIRYNYVPLFDAHHVDLVLSGHSHIYQRGNQAPQFNKKNIQGDALWTPRAPKKQQQQQKSTTYVICGGGGGELEKPTVNRVVDYQFYTVTKFEFHYLKLRTRSCRTVKVGVRAGLRGRLCRLEVKATNPQTGLIIDSFTLYQ